MTVNLLMDARRRASDEDFSLPGWIYRDADFLRAEKRQVFATSWQIVCHLSDIPAVGDYHTLDFLGEPIVAVRTRDDGVKAFFNVCRHRASRLLDGASGHCPGRIVCPYHAWTYDLDGALVAVPHRKEFVDFATEHYGLKPLEIEIYKGFVFVRLQPGTPSVAEMLAPYEKELACYRLEELEPLGRVTLRLRQVNWKNVTDNYSDAMHIAVAHPWTVAIVRPIIRNRGGAVGGQDVGTPSRRALGAAIGAHVSGPAAARTALAREPATFMDLLQVVAERCIRRLSGSGRFYANDPDITHRNARQGDRLRASRREARNADRRGISIGASIAGSAWKTRH